MDSLSLAVVGHTNTGKTSLMRTLLRDSQFGEVANAAATTRHVEEAFISDAERILVRLYDTPGLEDAGGILDWLETHTDRKQDGIDRLQQFLASPEAQHEFSQEAKVLRQLLASDMALYVLDAREPVLPKYRDELTVLSWCAKPIMPVFNFTRGQDLGEWQATLARRNLHITSSFDTVAFDFEGEIRLWDNLATMLPQRLFLDRLTAMRRREWQRLEHTAKNRIAHFLLDVAAYRQTFEDETRIPEIQSTMQQAVRQLERHLQQSLLQDYRFYHNSLESSDWALQAFAHDPFDGELLKNYGIRTTTGAATGALIGLGVDTLTLGFSLGLGTAIGGIIGSIVPNWQTLSDKLSGVDSLYIDAATLTLLAARGLDLLHTLQHRGHADQNTLTVGSGRAPWQPEKLPSPLRKARARPKWSSLNGTDTAEAEAQRQEAAIEIAGSLK